MVVSSRYVVSVVISDSGSLLAALAKHDDLDVRCDSVGFPIFSITILVQSMPLSASIRRCVRLSSAILTFNP